MNVKKYFAVALLLVLFPLTTSAASVRESLRTHDDSVVSRGDFIRAAIKVLNVPLDSRDRKDLPYLRIPKGLVPYVQTAHSEGALLHVFGSDLRLGQGITRGEALQILVGLKNIQSGAPTNFRDVTEGTTEQKAVSAAITKGWMEPLRDNLFGVSRKLTGRSGKILLQRVSGNTNGFDAIRDGIEKKDIPTIRLRLGTTKTRSSILPKSEILEAIWQIINNEYLYIDNVDIDDAAYRSAEGLVKSLDDPYTTYLRPANNRSFQTQIQGEVSGIGAQVEERDGILTIVTPLRSSPAERAGLKPNDQILKVNEEDIVNIGFIEAVEKVRGPIGSQVKLRVRRDGIEFDVEVTRAKISVPEVEISWQGEIAVVKLLQFGRITESELRGGMEQVQKQNPKGIVLDLRNNPGGLLNAANVVLSNFLPLGSDIAQIKSRANERIDTTKEAPTIKNTVPVVVLVNEGSASASEIVAGALQDASRAKVLGKPTFGKGTVQEVLQFHDGSSLKMTVAEWYTPDGNKIDGIGVIPDIEVEFNDQRDEQMLRALELLR